MVTLKVQEFEMFVAPVIASAKNEKEVNTSLG